MPLKPPRLRFGDTVALLAPASPPHDPANIDRAAQTIKRLGFKVRLPRHVRRRRGFLAGSDQQRAHDLVSAFADPKIKAIFCARGGYGSGRLLPLLDYKLIGRNPKIFAGFSDITALHCALLSRANLISFHGPMINADFIKGVLPQFTIATFLRVLMEPAPLGSICNGCQGQEITVLHRGKASGKLVGGNLSLLCASVGTPFQPSFRDCILFFEDVDEEPYRFDRMLTQLLHAGLLAQVSGIAIGLNKNCQDPKAPKTREFRQTLLDVFKERLLPLRVPIVAGLPFGHLPHNATLPVGTQALLDAHKGDLVLLEPAVT